MGFDKLNLIRSGPTEKTIAGADCSGSKELPNETWLAVGTLTGAGLELTRLSKIGMHALSSEIAKLTKLHSVGLDFPFSLPRDFLDYLADKADRPKFQEWQEVVEHLVFMPLEQFQDYVHLFKKESKRYTDKAATVQGISPLHRGNPSMVQMTWHGMRTLASLNPERFAVQPFQDAVEGRCNVLEVYPRATLKCLGLPDTGYKVKDKKEKDKMQSVRHHLLQGLLSSQERVKHGVPKLMVPQKFEHFIVDSDNAFDAVVACYAAAMHANDESIFVDPLQSDNVDVLIEGWIFEPGKLLTTV